MLHLRRGSRAGIAEADRRAWSSGSCACRRASREPGSGLGLSLAAAVARLHGGELTAGRQCAGAEGGDRSAARRLPACERRRDLGAMRLARGRAARRRIAMAEPAKRTAKKTSWRPAARRSRRRSSPRRNCRAAKDARARVEAWLGEIARTAAPARRSSSFLPARKTAHGKLATGRGDRRGLALSVGSDPRRPGPFSRAARGRSRAHFAAADRGRDARGRSPRATTPTRCACCAAARPRPRC